MIQRANAVRQKTEKNTKSNGAATTTTKFTKKRYCRFSLLTKIEVGFFSVLLKIERGYPLSTPPKNDALSPQLTNKLVHC